MDMDIVVLNEESREIDGMAVRAVMSLPPGVIDRSKQSDTEGAPQLVVTASTPEASVRPLARGSDSPDKGVIPVAPTEEPVLMKGNLQKLGKVFKGWHQRYFEIQGRHMYHYKSPAKHHCLGEIDLNICFYAGPTTVATFGHPFELRTTQRTHVFAARTYDEMHRWIEVIQANMGTPELGEVKQKVKVKRWQSIKSTFSLQPRRHSSQDPSASLGGHEKRAKKVDRNKSFMQRLRNLRHRSSPSSDDELSPEHYQRPKSMTSQTRLEPVLEPPPSPRSLPNTPLVKKRDAHKASPPASPISVEVFPISSSTEALESPSHVSSTSPARSLSPEVETGTVSATGQEESQTGTTEPEEPPVQLEAKRTEPAIPEFISKRFVWDEIKELLESLPERSESYSYEELSPQETGWEDKPTGMEQLREFLAVCA